MHELGKQLSRPSLKTEGNPRRWKIAGHLGTRTDSARVKTFGGGNYDLAAGIEKQKKGSRCSAFLNPLALFSVLSSSSFSLLVVPGFILCFVFRVFFLLFFVFVFCCSFGGHAFV